MTVEDPAARHHQSPSGRHPRGLYVGTYAAAGGRGFYPLRSTAYDGLEPGLAFVGVQNASYAVTSARHGLIYLVNEQAHGMITVCRGSPLGLSMVDEVETGGSAPCHLALSPAEDLLAVANYASGSIAVFRLDPATGRPLRPPQIRQNAGRGSHPDRQEGPHAHCVRFTPDGHQLYHTDLGTDEILVYPVSPRSRALGGRLRAWQAPAGSGPRHILFNRSGQLAYLVSELASTITGFEVAGNTLLPRQTLSTLPPDCVAESLGGHLALSASEDRLYVSNRGHDSIAVFSVSGTGELTQLQHCPSGGRSPRQFLLREARADMLIVHEGSAWISALRLDGSGRMTRIPGETAVPGAAFIMEL